jgi:[acyl-carrier-protein] S-malonyltransferase
VGIVPLAAVRRAKLPAPPLTPLAFPVLLCPMLASRIILCPGQGAQAVGMGKAWFDASPEARGTFEEADRLLAGRLPGGAKLSDLCFAGPVEVLNRTEVSQPAIYTCSVACWRGLLARWDAGTLERAGVMATAGLSLGEYTALHIAGSFSFKDGLELVALRGRAMQEAAEAVPSGMVALIGATEEQAHIVCEQTLQGQKGEVLVVANLNAPGQVVISGHKSACDRACSPGGPVEKAGLRATPLPVAGAFHSPIMAPAAERLGTALAKAAISPPHAIVVSNVTAKPHPSTSPLPLSPSGADSGIVEQIRRRLVEQLTAPVRWEDSCAWLTSGVWGSGTFIAGQPGGGAEFHELAPGKTLAGLMRRIEKAVKVHTHDLPTD